MFPRTEVNYRVALAGSSNLWAAVSPPNAEQHFARQKFSILSARVRERMQLL
jgi:hypothetical protein